MTRLHVSTAHIVLLLPKRLRKARVEDSTLVSVAMTEVQYRTPLPGSGLEIIQIKLAKHDRKIVGVHKQLLLVKMTARPLRRQQNHIWSIMAATDGHTVLEPMSMEESTSLDFLRMTTRPLRRI